MIFSYEDNICFLAEYGIAILYFHLLFGIMAISFENFNESANIRIAVWSRKQFIWFFE
jgi:hypothetical protein